MSSGESSSTENLESQTQIGSPSPRRDPWVDHLIYLGVPLTTRNWLEARYEDPDITWHEVDGDVEIEMPEGLIEDRPGKPPGRFRHK